MKQGLYDRRKNMEHWRLTFLLKHYWEDEEIACSGSYKIIDDKIKIEYVDRHIQFTGWKSSIFEMKDVLNKIKANIKIEIDTKISEIANLEDSLKRVKEYIIM
jgi:hypothetical protein